MSSPRQPLVEILYFDGCPNYEAALALVERISRELGLEPEVRLVNVRDQEAAERLGFLGSPTIRVGGVDVDPRTDERDDHALSCRVFRTEQGIVGRPDEQWVRRALAREAAVARPTVATNPAFLLETDGGAAIAGGAEVALAAAAIPRSRRGRERTRGLAFGERALYQWILRRFAAATPPQARELADAAARFDVGLEHALDTFATEDLVHCDRASGAIAVAYPFAGRPRGHRVLIDGSTRVEAMCAIDALGISALLNAAIEVSSHDPSTRTEVWVRLDPGDGAWWEPQTAVVLAGTTCDVGPSFRGCCDVLNFFETRAGAERYLREHPSISGLPISIPDAIEAGRAAFGGLLEGH